MDGHELKQTTFDLLGFSEDFCTRCNVMGFAVPDDIFLLEPRELVSREGFTYEWLVELVTFLQERQLLHLLQPIPGKSSG